MPIDSEYIREEYATDIPNTFKFRTSRFLKKEILQIGFPVKIVWLCEDFIKKDICKIGDIRYEYVDANKWQSLKFIKAFTNNDPSN